MSNTNSNNLTIFFVSLGCDKNLVDSEVMLGILRAHGFTLVDDEMEADIIVVNTCSFIHDAKEESIQTILEMAEMKHSCRCKALIVTGCMAERYKDEIMTEIEEVDAVIGTTSYQHIAEVVAVVGESQDTARYARINVKRTIIRTMGISGGICGIAGFLLVSGASHTISTSTAGGRGFTAIIVAWLSKFNAFVMILVSFFLVFMEKGAIQIASQFNLNENASDVITGIILFFILGSEFFIRYRIAFTKAHK